MRTIHDNLLAAQQSGAANPYIHLSIDGTDYTSRLFPWSILKNLIGIEPPLSLLTQTGALMELKITFVVNPSQ